MTFISPYCALARVLRFVICGLSFHLLPACGGSSDEADSATTTAVDQADAQQRILAASNPAGTAVAAVTTWVRCADEGQVCALSGSNEIRYGTVAAYVSKVMVGATACNNAVFGDPAYGTVKACWYAAQAIDPASWTLCAAEGGTCNFTDTRNVLYGAATRNVAAVFTSSTACTNGVFGDPAYGTVKSCWFSNQPISAGSAASPAVTLAPGPSGLNYPTVVNASASAHPGDVVSLQGDNFGSAPSVYFEGAPAAPLVIVNRVASNWVAVQIPANAPSALILRVANGTGVSAQVKLNAARPLHLDTLRLTAGGSFKVFGRNLLVAGSTPRLTVDGLSAPIDTAHSDEYMLSVVAPSALVATASASVVVDNGNGSGPATLDRPVSALAAHGNDPFALGVGWGADFAALARNSIDAATDARLAARMSCDGQRDDTRAVQAAIDLAASLGGGLVRLPAGNCRLAGVINLRSNVVVQGAGKASTQLGYESNYPFYGVNLDLLGIKDLTLVNKGTATEGPLLKSSSRVFLQGVRVRLMTSRQMYLTGNQQFVVANCDFEQAGSISGQGPYRLDDSSGLLFEGNTTLWLDGAPAFVRVHDAYLHANRFTRDGRNQNAGGTVHSMVIDFAHRIAVVGNSFDVAYGPISNTMRNDGETILTEGGGGQRTENLGTVSSAGSNTFSDPANTLQVDPFGTGSIPENYGVAIVAGQGAGQTRRLVAYHAPQATVDRAWEIVPDSTSRYATFVWGLEKSIIKDNTLSQNPRGIWLYQTAIQDVAVVGNTIAEGGGIFLRAYQNLAAKQFMPQYNVIVSGNRVSNTNGRWMSYLNSVFVNVDAQDFGIATIGVEVKSNQLTANRPNATSSWEDYANAEGYMNMMRVESNAPYQTLAPRLLGAIFSGNACTNCDVALRIGTGAGGTTISNMQLVDTPILSTDWATTSSAQKSTGTVVR